MSEKQFEEFNKIARLSRNCVITEKIDGTNASIFIGENGEFLTGSRTRWITPEDDNFGFSRWAHANKEELLKLGSGMHYGEWWGLGIQRNYGIKEKRFSLFNTSRWLDDATRPACCSVVPVLFTGLFDTSHTDGAIEHLATYGSQAAPGFMKPEGVVIWHEAARIYFKKTIEKDEAPKGKRE
jgi:hypothetical protein